MSMIACNKECVHQREGYCSLNTITSLSKETDEKCGYFETKRNNTKGIVGRISDFENFESL